MFFNPCNNDAPTTKPAVRKERSAATTPGWYTGATQNNPGTPIMEEYLNECLANARHLLATANITNTAPNEDTLTRAIQAICDQRIQAANITPGALTNPLQAQELWTGNATNGSSVNIGSAYSFSEFSTLLVIYRDNTNAANGGLMAYAVSPSYWSNYNQNGVVFTHYILTLNARKTGNNSFSVVAQYENNPSNPPPLANHAIIGIYGLKAQYTSLLNFNAETIWSGAAGGTGTQTIDTGKSFANYDVVTIIGENRWYSPSGLDVASEGRKHYAVPVAAWGNTDNTSINFETNNGSGQSGSWEFGQVRKASNTTFAHTLDFSTNDIRTQIQAIIGWKTTSTEQALDAENLFSGSASNGGTITLGAGKSFADYPALIITYRHDTTGTSGGQRTAIVPPALWGNTNQSAVVFSETASGAALLQIKKTSNTAASVSTTVSGLAVQANHKIVRIDGIRFLSTS